MPTTTNNGWPTPADTDLVKNGADAIRDLGNAIDTTLGVYSPLTPGLVKISTTNFTGVASQSFNNVFTTTYDNYRITGNLSLSNTTANLLMRYRKSGTDESGANYTGGMVAFTGGAGAFGTGTGSATATSMTLSLNLSNETGVSFSFDVMQPQITETTPCFGFSKRRNNRIDVFSFNYYFTDSYDGFTILPGAGNITGSVSVYGYSK